MSEVAGAVRHPLLLDDDWRAITSDERLALIFHEPDLDDGDWTPLTLPSSWRAEAAFAESDGPVLYRRRVPCFELGDEERAWLVAGRVFSEADVWWNGHYLGDVDGYFAEHAFELDPILLDGPEHTLAIEVRHRRSDEIDGKQSIVGTFDDPRVVDPRGNPGGIWIAPRIERTGPLRLSWVRVRCNEASPAVAVLTVTATIDSLTRCTALLSTSVAGTEHSFSQPLTIGENRVEWLVSVPDPELWWPRGLGDPHLVDVQIDVAENDSSVVSDRRRLRTGIRAVEMKNWTLRINGERMFAKGVNLAPTGLDLASITPEDAELDLRLALDAGFDLVRLRGHIAHPGLYDAADRLGLLIWQDFPLWRGYSKRVRRRAVRLVNDAVNQLAHHPSVVVWCAHDTPTPDGIDDPATPRPRYGGARAALGQQLPTWNKSVLDRSVKHTIDKYDGTRPVVAHSGQWPHPPQLDGTDTHLWFGWRWGEGRDLEKLAARMPRAVRWVSEFGAASVPDSAQFCEPDRWPLLDFDRLAVDHGYERYNFEAHQSPADFATFDEWRIATQRYQAQIVRRQIEVLRRLKYRPTGGFCLDHLVDSWPAISTSLVDHEREPKLAYDAAFEALAPVIVVADRLPTAIRPGQALAFDVHVVNDHRHEVAATVAAELRWPSAAGTPTRHRWAWQGVVEADSVARVGTISWVAPGVAGPVTLILALTGDADATNRYDTEIA
jgi:beta-mannosidase